MREIENVNDRQNGEALARIAGAISDASRATMLLGMLDGRAWTAAELAAHAGIARSTATSHLHLLVESGLVEERRSGKHRYLRLADERSAALIETMTLSTTPPPPHNSLRAVGADQAMRIARTCYDHLAGALGVGIFDGLISKDYLAEGPELHLTKDGEDWCQSIGVDLAAAHAQRRPFARHCLDWTERKEHLAGALSTALMERFMDLKWIARGKNPRTIRVLGPGLGEFERQLGVGIER